MRNEGGGREWVCEGVREGGSGCVRNEGGGRREGESKGV